jgi:hypothetical protein
MSHRKTLSRLTVASLAAAALAAPAAMAKPIDPTGPSAADMHRGTETAPPVRHPRALPPPDSLPINRAPAQTVDAGGAGDDAVLALVIGGALVLGGGATLTAARHRAHTAH